MPDASLPLPNLIDLDTTYLPIAEMRQITRITSLQGAVITGEMELGPNHWVYPQHFPGDPIFPGSLVIEAAGQLIALWAWAQGQRGRPRLVRTSAEFHAPVGPETPHLFLHAEVRRKRYAYFGSIHITSIDAHMASVEGTLVVLA